MSTVSVKAQQATTDWDDGAEFTVERTPLVESLIQSGGLVVLGETFDDSDAEAHGFDLSAGPPAPDAPPTYTEADHKADVQIAYDAVKMDVELKAVVDKPTPKRRGPAKS